MAVHIFSRLAFAALAIAAAAPVFAGDIDELPVTATFVVSTGFWEEVGGEPSGKAEAKSATGTDSTATDTATRRGYYKLVAIRQPDRTAKVYLQQIALDEAGLQVVESVELEEFTAIKPYVTDIRPEDSTGISRQPGLFATVYLKTDPAATEPESWTVLIDEFGEIKIEKATN